MTTRRTYPRAARALLIATGASFSSFPSLALAKDTTTAEASPVAVSEQRAAEAFQAYSRKEYAAAVALYLDAYEAAPSGSILFNIARIYDLKLGDRPLAMTYYRRYITAPDGFTERIELANQRLKELREAEASAIQLQTPDPAPQTSEPSPSERSAAPEASRGDGGGWSTLRWTGVTLGVVGLGAVSTGVAFGVAALSEANTANEACDGNACVSQRGVDASHSASTNAKLSNVGFGAGGALLLTGAALFFWGADEGTESSARANLRWETQLSDSGASLQVAGKW